MLNKHSIYENYYPGTYDLMKVAHGSRFSYINSRSHPNKQQLQTQCVQHSYSLAWRIGACLHNARAEKKNPVDELVDVMKGRKLITGVIQDVLRRTGIQVIGEVTIESQDPLKKKSKAKVKFKNENLMCSIDDNVEATVPDLVCIIDADTGRGIFVDELQIGLRVAVITAPSPRHYRHGIAAKLAGPKELGLDDIEMKVMENPREEGESICTEYQQRQEKTKNCIIL